MYFTGAVVITLCTLPIIVLSAPTPQLLSPSAGKDISNLKGNAKALEKDQGVSTHTF
jgi:hypothetical protein